jgi:hypothetical protein
MTLDILRQIGREYKEKAHAKAQRGRQLNCGWKTLEPMRNQVFLNAFSFKDLRKRWFSRINPQIRRLPGAKPQRKMRDQLGKQEAKKR